MCASVTFGLGATAHAAQPEVVVLRSDLTVAQLAAVIDGELASALIERAHFNSSYFSPTPYADIELAAGCHGGSDECVNRVATSLNAERVLVRELRRDATGALVLTLVAKDDAAEGTRRTESVVTAAGDTRPERVVPELVERLYGNATNAQLVQLPPSPIRPARVAGYTVLSTSLAFLASGVGVGVASKKSHDHYKHTDVSDAQSAERADSWLRKAERQARTANILYATSAAVASTGIAILLWDRAKRERNPPVTVEVSAGPGTAMLGVSGSMGRF